MRREVLLLVLVAIVIKCNGRSYDECDFISHDCGGDVHIDVRSHQTISKTSFSVCKSTTCHNKAGLTKTRQFVHLTSALNWILETKYIGITLTGSGNYTELVAKTILEIDLPMIMQLKLSNIRLHGPIRIKQTFIQLQQLDLSNNNITVLIVDEDVPIRWLNVSDNFLVALTGLEYLGNVEMVDLSNNHLSVEGIQHLPMKIEYLNLQNNPQLFHELKIENFENENKNEIGYLDLSNNEIKEVKNIFQIFVKFSNVEVIDLSGNKIRTLHEGVFPESVYENTKKLRLSQNEITEIGPNTFSTFKVLHWLDLTDNLLQHLPIIVLPVKENIHNRVARSANNITKLMNQTLDVSILSNISLTNNPWSCDCFSAVYNYWVINSNKTNTVFDIVCQNPSKVAGRRISGLNASELVCVNATAQVANSSYDEFTDAVLHCNVTGAPLPIPYWISPTNETISAEVEGFDTGKYSISPDGQHLTIHYLRYHGTGKYRCVADNKVSHVHADCIIGVVLAPFGTVVAIVASSVSFFVAMLLNMVNLCDYMTDHFKKQKEKKKAQKKLEEERKNLENAKLREKEFYESAASLNANRYYGKYDFTCQQMFLDTVVKGAHTVKKTIYDAKNSEFSNNMWEYAAYLRDRLHIELPTVQRPRVSMPTISMPNISIPSFQGINTNFEKIGSSVSHRGHKIGTAVGSVFTLRWLRSANPSDQSSGDESEAGPSNVQQRVKVHVHHYRHASMASTCSSDYEERPALLKQTPKEEKGNHRRTKSVRFYKEETEFVPGKPRRTASFTTADDENTTNVQETPLPTVSNSVHEIETCL